MTTDMIGAQELEQQLDAQKTTLPRLDLPEAAPPQERIRIGVSKEEVLSIAGAGVAGLSVVAVP